MCETGVIELLTDIRNELRSIRKQLSDDADAEFRRTINGLGGGYNARVSDDLRLTELIDDPCEASVRRAMAKYAQASDERAAEVASAVHESILGIFRRLA